MKSEEDIQRFEWIHLNELKQIAAELRATPPPRKAWGDWRAITHELVFELMVTN